MFSFYFFSHKVHKAERNKVTGLSLDLTAKKKNTSNRNGSMFKKQPRRRSARLLQCPAAAALLDGLRSAASLDLDLWPWQKRRF